MSTYKDVHIGPSCSGKESELGDLGPGEVSGGVSVVAPPRPSESYGVPEGWGFGPSRGSYSLLWEK